MLLFCLLVQVAQPPGWCEANRGRWGGRVLVRVAGGLCCLGGLRAGGELLRGFELAGGGRPHRRKRTWSGVKRGQWWGRGQR